MNQVAPEMLDLALWLIARESVDGELPEKVSGTFCICEKLRGSLVTLVGAAGYRSLLSRALSLAKKDAPSLEDLQVKEDGSLAWPGTLELQPDLDKVPHDGARLVAQLLELLASFIGQSLTLLLVRESWPGAPFNYINSTTEKQL